VVGWEVWFEEGRRLMVWGVVVVVLAVEVRVAWVVRRRVVWRRLRYGGGWYGGGCGCVGSTAEGGTEGRTSAESGEAAGAVGRAEKNRAGAAVERAAVGA
jgi:hypothetical protein